MDCCSKSPILKAIHLMLLVQILHFIQKINYNTFFDLDLLLSNKRLSYLNVFFNLKSKYCLII